MPKDITKSITFEWIRPRYLVKWAENPDEVPLFDISRGGDPYAIYEKKGSLSYSTSWRRENPFINISNNDPNLGGKYDAPQDNTYFNVLSSFDPEKDPLPKEAIVRRNYPRIVRITTEPENFKKEPAQRVCEALAKLYRFHNNESLFRKEAIKFVETYSILSWRHPNYPNLFNEALSDWIEAASWFHFHLQLIREINKSHSIECIHFWLSRESYRGKFENTNKLIDRSKSLNELRVILSQYFWDIFRLNQLVQIAEHPGKTLVFCGAHAWGCKELWQIASESIEIRECLGCRSPFIADRKDKEVCSKNCNVKKHRRKK